MQHENLTDYVLLFALSINFYIICTVIADWPYTSMVEKKLRAILLKLYLVQTGSSQLKAWKNSEYPALKTGIEKEDLH